MIFWFILLALPRFIHTADIIESTQSSKRNIDGANWMRNNIDTLGKRTLKEICMPGSHDSGMSSVFSGTSMAHPCNVQTQSLPIKGQLEYGARYFDVRPDIVTGRHFFTGHYMKLPGGHCLGANGQSLVSIVSDINQFIASHNELVIVKLSHSLNSERCGRFSMHEWERALRILDNTQNLYIDDDVKVRLDNLTLNHFTNNGTKGAVLFIVSQPEVRLWHRLGRGFFYETNLNIYDDYANTYKLSTMMNDQMKKMKEVSKKYFFILSWTLTQGAKNAILCPMNLAKSIRQLAVQAHESLPKIIAGVNPSAFPNVIYVDDIKDTDVVSMAMDINNKYNRLKD